MFRNAAKEEIKVAAEMRHLAKLRDFIERIGTRHRFDAKFISSLKLTIDEICTNIIRHGYRDVKNGEIYMAAIVRRLSMTLLIIDRGKTWDPRQTKDPDLNEYVRIGKRGGLGTFMVRKLVDDIQYTVTNRGNELRLTKYREAPEARGWQRLMAGVSMRMRYFATAVLLITIAGGSVFFYLESSNRQARANSIEAITQSLGQNLALIAQRDMQDLLYWEETRDAYISAGALAAQVAIYDNRWTPRYWYPTDSSEYDQRSFLDSMRARNDFSEQTIVAIDSGASPLTAYIMPIPGPGDVIAGYSVVFARAQQDLAKGVTSTWESALLVLLFMTLGYATAWIFIGRQFTPLLQLADWVRQVGKGQVDEDALDIDASDELGEIAEAFSEMTVKFRESQQSLIERQRMHRELQVAQEIQQMLLPNDFPEVYGYDLSSYYQAAKEVGGDLFDFVDVDDDCIGIIVADVSGKGVPGSMVMTMIRTAIRMEARANRDPADVLSRVNAFVTGDIRKGMFVTALYVILDSKNRTISYASAGHNPLILFRGKTTETYYLNPPGFPLGITLPDEALFAKTIRTDRIRLHPDDVLVVYTDGVTEAMNPERELFSEGRFLEAIRAHGGLSVGDFINHLQEDIARFTRGFEQNDDITLVAVKESMEAEELRLQQVVALFEKVDAHSISVRQGCEEIGISTTTYYRYRDEYQQGGLEAVADVVRHQDSNPAIREQKWRKIRAALLQGDGQPVKARSQWAGISPSTFYRYHKKMRAAGYARLRERFHGYTSLGQNHLSIEIKTRLYALMQENPSRGARRLSKLLNTYEKAAGRVSEAHVYAELKRAKLTTREQRAAFVKRGGKQRLKAPGTPLLTLDGEIILGVQSDREESDNLFKQSANISAGVAKERILGTTAKG
jgi:serine phosphatase RsbU (regulator of sigma subunit)/anti-sigma regulatory factor (Ser/Thr protein kinase)/ACT domain-containing protein